MISAVSPPLPTVLTAGLPEPVVMGADTLYVTDHPEALVPTKIARTALFTPDLRERWAGEKSQVIFKKGGERVLCIGGFEVMRDFETPYMEKLAEAAVVHGGKILNVGYGLGIVDEYIECFRASAGVVEHHIIELNHEISQEAEAWRQKKPTRDQIVIHQGDWKALLPKLKGQGIVFDSVVFDAFPLEEGELHRDFIPFFEVLMRLQLVKPYSGVVTFYMDSLDGFGERFLAYARRLGVQTATTEKKSIELPPEGTQYWSARYYFVPVLSGIQYPA